MIRVVVDQVLYTSAFTGPPPPPLVQIRLVDGVQRGHEKDL